MAAGAGLVVADGIDADALARAIVDSASEFVVVVAPDATIVATNHNLAAELRYAADDLIGRSALDLIDPVDLPRALLVLSVSNDQGAPPGTVSFGLRRSDGTVIPAHLTGCDTQLGDQRLITVIGRPSYMLGAVETLLDRLLAGSDLTEVVGPITEFFAWRENGSHVGICWWEHGVLRSVGTGLDPRLVGEDSTTGGPWEIARRTGTAVEIEAGNLDEPLRSAALAAGVCHGWIQPVAVDRLEVPALVTVWTSLAELPPAIHGFAMAAAARYVEMVLRWTDQVARLDEAAHGDPLTGVSNRRAFFDALDGDGRGGAVLYCDLDGFKAVNDGLGHAAGDELLRVVAARLLAEVREGDLVARLGGDEFGVLLWDADPTTAAMVADRLRATCRAPIEVAGTQVSVGISVGVAHDEPLGERTVERADQALYAEKRRVRRVDRPGSECHPTS